MESKSITELTIIAGNGAYPRLLADSARAQGVRRLVAIAFKKETDRRLEPLVDEIHWITLGQFGSMLDALQASGVQQAVMAGQITPTHLYRLRPDARMLKLLSGLRRRNAETIFGAVADELRGIGVELLPAYRFMESHMPQPGLLTQREPTESEQDDIRLGMQVAHVTSGLDIGQTVVIKQGTILAVEAFEGTDRTIRRAAKLGGKGIVIVKVAKPNQDMRFDIPVVGLRTMKLLRKVGAAALAVEAGRTILLERDEIVRRAEACHISIVAVPGKEGRN